MHSNARGGNSDARVASEGPRATIKTLLLIVGRGPVPRHRSIAPTRAEETRSDARMETSEGPRATVLHQDPEVSPTERIEI